MKKLLVISTALAGVTLLSAPASAALKMDLGGYFRGYGVYTDNNEVGGAGANLRNFDFRRDNELHFNGETTLDNGLTVGAHTELKVGGSASNDGNANHVDETYAYFSGGWGRVNFGQEDGAAYLLQVAAPSADSNIDGMRVYIQALQPRTLQTAQEGAGGAHAAAQNAANNDWNFDPATLDYQQADHRQVDRLTYLTPKFNGFQAGLSYAPKTTANNVGSSIAAPVADNVVNGAARDLWEAAARWDGEYQGVGISLGGGYSGSSFDTAPTLAVKRALTAGQYDFTDSTDSWNIMGNLTYSGFSLGGGFVRNETSRTACAESAGLASVCANAGTETLRSGDISRDTWVVGGAYDNGPYHLGLSYLNASTDYAAITGPGTVGATDHNITAQKFVDSKWAAGAGYTFGPGMTFRGAVAWGKFDAPTALGAAADNRYMQTTLGTDIQF